MKYIINESQEEIVNDYFGQIDNGFYNHIASNLEVEDIETDSGYPFVVLYICDKPKLLTTSKRHLVDVLVMCFGDEFESSEATKRLTAKKVVDDLRQKFYII